MKLESMREITETEAFDMAGDADCPVLAKAESDPMEAAVCLKRFPGGYVLGVSDKERDLRLWFTPHRGVAEENYRRCVRRMQDHGTPFGGPAAAAGVDSRLETD